VDTIVLGCTHFPFLRPLIADIAGPNTAIIDTGPAVAAQVARVAGSAVTVTRHDRRELRCATTGSVEEVAGPLARVWGEPLPLEQISL
jgi:glutamate racemase